MQILALLEIMTDDRPVDHPTERHEGSKGSCTFNSLLNVYSKGTARLIFVKTRNEGKTV